MSQHEHDQSCAQCGAEVDPTDHQYRFSWPDLIFAEFMGQTPPDAWMSGPTAVASTMLQTPDYGHFLRALLQVRLQGGSQITYGVWMSVSGQDFERACAVWDDDEQYPHLKVPGRLANDISPGSVLGASVQAVVREVEHTPYLDSSQHPILSQLLSDVWDPQVHARALNL